MLSRPPVFKNPYQGLDPATCQDERERPVLEHSHLVKHIALRLISRLPDCVCVDDLFSAGIIGLIDAIDKYDAGLGIPFEYYAKIRIRGAMLDEVRSMDWIPRSLRQKSSLLEKTCNGLEQRLGRCPEDEEVACELGMGMDEYHRLIDETKGISLLPENIHDALSENRESDFLASDSDQLFQDTYRKQIRKVLAQAITTLSDKEQMVLALYYQEELTMKEIGLTLGYTESRISQIHTKAVLKLKTKLARKLSKEDLPEGLEPFGCQTSVTHHPIFGAKDSLTPWLEKSSKKL